MWQELVTCSQTYNVAFCLPVRAGGSYFPIYWYGILAAVGIILGTLYAKFHVDAEGEDGEMIWDALIWALIAGLIGARFWYIGLAVLGGREFDSVLDVINPRQGGMNIFGGAVFGLIALIIYSRVAKKNFWLIGDAALMGLLIGPGIGRFGNLINIELYGPPTGSNWFGLLVPADKRLPDFPVSSFPVETTRFHLTMLYEAAWLFLVFGLLYYLFRRYQNRAIQGAISGAYLILTGIGRFALEFIRPDQPKLPPFGGGEFTLTYSQIMSVLYVAFGIIVLLDRYGYVKIPGITRPQTLKQREAYYHDLERQRRRVAMAHEKEAQRAARRAARHERRAQVRQEKATASVAASDEASSADNGSA